ncbi:unnamed protein product [Anisakis simplex]|uniref:Putative g-protein coupled receptor (inferred by orthology to a S. mansoni protein) n=1 Tax=Anisakis simplex TaxID=6269 RepID=A0A0M3JV89_ANISI|nr:unnamed protein product [Anisakis simplex]
MDYTSILLACSNSSIYADSNINSDMAKSAAVDEVKAVISGGDNCHLLNLSASQPLWLARPIYGLAAPIIVLVTLITNSLVVIVLSHRNLRTPTNHILLAMAITELMTGLSSCPWFIYYYTLGGFSTDQREGLTPFWCRFHSYFAVHFPTIFHTSAIWLTVFLAIQRYVYVCVPSMVSRYCNPSRTRQMIVLIGIAALLNETPLMLFETSISVQLDDTSKRFCIRLYTSFVEKTIGANAFYSVIHCYRAVFVHILPCALLILFTGKLFRTINKADRKRSYQSFPSRKSAYHTTSMLANSASFPSSSRLMQSTTKMLVVVIAIFLLIEIPVALIFLLHFVVVVYGLMPRSMYQPINNLIIIRNFMIILTYPFNFAIYFGMSSSFQLQFRQLFTRKILYVAAPQSQLAAGTTSVNHQPRFSIPLIDIRKFRRPSAVVSCLLCLFVSYYMFVYLFIHASAMPHIQMINLDMSHSRSNY